MISGCPRDSSNGRLPPKMYPMWLPERFWIHSPFDARHPCMNDLFMLMQMVSDVNLLMSQATALDSESQAAWEAWDSAADAVDQAELALLEADADPHSDRNRKLELHLKLQEALDDESKKEERYQQIQKQLEEHCTERRELILYLDAPSEPSAPLLYQQLLKSSPANAQYKAIMPTRGHH